ncbi:MAG: penicillin-binding transpeptidase domain-containing protein [Candidatus Binatia bacterium]
MSGRSMRQRIVFVAALFAAVFGGLALRAVYLTLIHGETLKQRADRQHRRAIPIAALRGEIVDRYGEPLALSRESAAVYLRPREFRAQPEAVQAVARLLELPQHVVLQHAAARKPFVWLQRQVPLERWTAVEDLQLAGIGSEPARQRVYPHGALAGQVLGFAGVDGHGLEGVERALDAELQGGVEAMVVARDARGRSFVINENSAAQPRAGAHVELTIDAALQRVAEEALEKAVQDFGARAGTVVALDPHTGEVLAMANVPRFDPNRFASATADQYRNRAITDLYEPGSTFKAILAAAAMAENVVRPDERISCENGRYGVGKRTIRDAHPHGVLSFADVIAQSSNIGCAKIAERLGRERFGHVIDAFGFGRLTGIDLPGEAPGMVRPNQRWGRIHLVTTAFGQGIAVTPLQLANAFATIANGGRVMRPYTVKRVTGADGMLRYAARPTVERQVLSPETAAAVTELLVGVTERGTGKQARIEGFAVAGKTGTAQKVDTHTGRYHPRDRMSSFVGFVPADDPALVVLVVVDSPRKATYGGVVAAPVFRAVAEYGLGRRGVLAQAAPPADGQQTPPAALADSASAIEEDDPFETLAAPGGVPSFLGLPMREALVRAHAEGWNVRLEGSGYVTRQLPMPGAVAADGSLTLYFGSGAS